MTQTPSAAKQAGPLGAERRRYQRYKIQLPAHIEAEASAPVECEILDFCTGGMLVLIEGKGDVESLFSVGGSVNLSTQLQALSEQRSITIPATVAWVGGNNLGISFRRPSKALAQILSKNSQLQKRGQKASGQKDVESNKSKLSRIRQIATEQLPRIMQAFMVDAMEALLQSADKVASDADRHQLYTDLNEIERMRSGSRLVEETIRAAFDPSGKEPNEDLDSSGELTLIDTDEFERWLEATRAATQLERSFSTDLTNIGSRLATGGENSSEEVVSSPFEPRHFTNALRAVSEQAHFGSLTRRVLFERYVETLKRQLADFYLAIKQVLGDVEAQGGLSPSQAMRRAATRETALAGRADDAKTMSQEAEQHKADEFSSSERATENAKIADISDAFTVAPAALQSLLAKEHELRQKQAHEWFANLSEVTEDQEGISGWLGQVDPSLLDEAAADPDFFRTDKHPLHSIVDALEHLQLLRGPKGSQETEALNKQVDAILAPLAEAPVETGTLNAVAKEVEDLSREQSEQYQRNVERVVEASEGRDRVRQARVAVQQELAQRYTGLSVPLAVAELIEVSWRYVLELAWLNKLTKPEGFEGQLAVLDDLIAYLGGIAFDQESPRRDKAKLFEIIVREMETTASDPFRRTSVETRIKAELFAAIDRSPELVALPPNRDKESVLAENDRPTTISEDAWKKALATCASIRLGDRLVFSDSTSANSENRVAWIRNDREVYTLVDHYGMRARDIGLTELAVDLHEGRIRHEAVDGKPVSKRAVEQMLDAMEDRLASLAAHDSVTGLMNRRQFHELLEKTLARQRLAGVSSSVLVWVDIDQFKLFNDMHGYATGDNLLAAIAGLLRDQPFEKALAHFGADRFAILFHETQLEEVQGWANVFSQEVGELGLEGLTGKNALTLSMGIVALKDCSAADAMGAAESALAAAKTAGGDRLYTYRHDDPDISSQRDSVKWVARVDEALVSGELRLRCQPIVPVRPGEGVTPHYEVLLGVTDGAKESLPIAEFIEAAERYRRMRAVDRWITESVFDWVAAHRKQMPLLHNFAVNVSGQTASDSTFVDFVRQQFDRTGVDPSWISFEITETAAVSTLTGTASIIHDLKKLGCKVALDDFGSGQASFAYLRELPVDWLKIDGAFVHNLANDRDNFAVVKSINEIGHFLGKQTIAEYVKDQPTLEQVREIGVDFAQGFGISPPMLLDDLLDSLV